MEIPSLLIEPFSRWHDVRMGWTVTSRRRQGYGGPQWLREGTVGLAKVAGRDWLAGGSIRRPEVGGHLPGILVPG